MKYVFIITLIAFCSCKKDVYRCECYTDRLVDTKEIKSNKHRTAELSCNDHFKEIQSTYPGAACYITN